MKMIFSSSSLRKLSNDQSGQVLVWFILGFMSIIAVAGLVIDGGQAYADHAILQNSANAAALAAAGSVYADSTTGNATTVGTSYSASTGDNNSSATLGGVGAVSTVITPVCLNMLQPSGTTCTSNPTSNAVHALQTNTVNTFFMRFFGVKTMTIKAEATATMNSVAQKWNVAIIEDATGSMSNTDTNCTGSPSEFQCALQGIQTLLKDTAPCQWGQATCDTSTANFRVSLWTFPNIITADLPFANACSGAKYTEPAPYQVITLPKPGVTGYTPLTYTSNGTKWTASYEVTYGASDADANGFVSDYYSPSSTSTGGLNASSSIVKAVGYGGNSGTKGCLVTAPNGIALNGATGTGSSNSIVNTVNVGEGTTYYAAVIYAAQSALLAEQIANPGSQNAMILLSDGQANTQWIYFPQGSLKQSPSANTAAPSTIVTGSTYPAGYDTLKSTPNTSAYVAAHYTNPTSEATGTISGMYPDFFDECQQAILAGQAATYAGTRVYAIAYGSEGTGCGSATHAQDYTDVTLVATGSNLVVPLNVPFTSLSALTPCMTMENIASSLTYFYSDYLQSGSGVDPSCQAQVNSFTNIGEIFQAISASFTTPRLIPNTAT
jgi:Flp pilus assembly protein TadG